MGTNITSTLGDVKQPMIINETKETSKITIYLHSYNCSYITFKFDGIFNCTGGNNNSTLIDACLNYRMLALSMQ